MFTTGRIIFAVLFLIGFIFLMVWSYKNDTENHKIFYENSAKKVAIYGSLLLIVFVIIRFFTRA